MFKGIREIVYKYWKYIGGTFKQPIITANDVDIEGMTVTSNNVNAWRMFDGDDDTSVVNNSDMTVEINFDEVHSFTNVHIYSRFAYLSHIAYASTLTFYSWENNEWKLIASKTGQSSEWEDTIELLPNTSNRYKIEIPRSYIAGSTIYYAQLNTIEFLEVAQIVPATKDDYDFITSVDSYKLPLINNKYYAVNN